MRRAMLFTTVMALSALSTSGCGEITKPRGVERKGYAPVRVQAALSGGGTKVASTTATEPDLHNDAICPASSLAIDVEPGGIGIRCDCTMTHAVYVCAAKGSTNLADAGLPECAADPLDTPMSQLRSIYVGKTSVEIVVPTLGLAGVNVFWCGDESTLNGPPLTCLANVTMIRPNEPIHTSRQAPSR